MRVSNVRLGCYVVGGLGRGISQGLPLWGPSCQVLRWCHRGLSVMHTHSLWCHREVWYIKIKNKKVMGWVLVGCDVVLVNIAG